MQKKDYKEIARQARIEVLGLIHRAGTSHIASNFSCIDLLSVLFEKSDLKKDKILFSKGWVAASAYYLLAQKGILNWDEVKAGYCDGKSPYIGLVEPTVPGIWAAGGSMGYGIPFGTGFALAKKLKNEEGKIYVLMSDGELDIGTTYESARIAAHHNLDNLIAIIDANGFQATGRKEEVLDVEPIRDFWQACHWDVREINGHDYKEIERALSVPHGSPLVIIARTLKGKGASFMEREGLRWHYQNIDDEHYKLALKELNKRANI